MVCHVVCWTLLLLYTYRQALADLDALTPQQDNERRMRPLYG